MKLVLVAVLIGSLKVTSYRSVQNQTDNSPFNTSTGEHVCDHGVAVSQDLLERWGGPLRYGDRVFIEHVGIRVVNDVMNSRHKQAADVWVASLGDEKAFHARFKGRRLKLWKIKIEEK